MRIWKEYYDEEAKRINIMEVSSGDKLFPTNLYDSQHGYYDSIIYARKGVDHANDDILNGKLFVRQCKECGIYYYANPDEDEWFTSRGLAVPKRCPKCRKHK